MNFEKVYNQLNPNQKQAVDHIEGSLMVVAGPGTGKTQVLGARIASILNKTDANPENILCLTFTDAATIALKQRLTQFIGSDAYKVNIYTYHGFCNMVIQENRELFGIQELDPISELEVLEVMKEIIDDLPNNSLLKRFRGDVYYDIADLSKLFGLLKKDNLTHKDIVQKSKEATADYLNSPEAYYKRKYGKYNAGDLKEKAYSELEHNLAKLQEACALLSVYDKRLAQRKRYDFNDMLKWVLDALHTNQDLLLKYQETFHYFLVDEYQDTNGIQNDILFTLINYWQNPNVFVVGDDDQSIYKFQGANVENIYEFYEKYEEDIKLVLLDKNYRSSQNILDGSNHVIKNNQERLVGRVEGLNKEIIAANVKVANITDALHIIEYPNSFQEIVSITYKLKELLKQGVDLSKVGILYRNHAQSSDLIKYLESEGIAYNVAKTQDVLEVPIVSQLNNMLTYFALETDKLDSGQHLLFEILHYNSFKYLSAFDIARLSNQLSKNRDLGWRNQLNAMAKTAEIPKESAQEVAAFVADVEYWIKELYNITLQSFVERIMSKMGFVSRALAAKDATFQIQSLKTYYNFLKEETARNPYITLQGFLTKIELLRSNKIGLKLNKIIHGINGVNLMTVHGSKGLEFEYVYLLGCTENKWEKYSNTLPYKLNLLIPGEPKKAMEEEARRLFYVALTRAEKHLEVSYAIKNDKDKIMNKSLYVLELEESNAARCYKTEAPESELLQFFNFMLTPQNQTYLNLVEQDFVKKEVENFRLSATNLNSYLKCPVTFFYQNIIRVPAAKSESMSFGTAIHYALDGLFKQLPALLSAEECKSVLNQQFKKGLMSNKEAFTVEGLERRLFYGQDVLGRYTDKYYESWQSADTEVKTELYLKNCEIDGVPIRGQIDKVEVAGKSVHVVDFKTGQYKNGSKKVKPPVSLVDDPEELNFEKRYGGDYWRQVLFYKALIESDKSDNLKVVSGEIDFIEPQDDDFKKVKILINEEEYEFVKQQIKTVFAKIQNREFEQGCEKEDCQWCNFNKSYQSKKEHTAVDLLRAPEEE